jgi:hypothetical protein
VCVRCNGHRVTFIERRITYDFRVPLSDDDREMEHSWRCIPVPPTADGDWFIIDSSSERKTIWGRLRSFDVEDSA